MTEKQRQNKLIKLKEKFAHLEDKLFEEKLVENEKLNRIGWGQGMRRVKCTISTTKSDKIKERIEKCKSEIKSLINETLD